MGVKQHSLIIINSAFQACQLLLSLLRNHLVSEMSENTKQKKAITVSQSTGVTSSNTLFCQTDIPKPTDVQFTKIKQRKAANIHIYEIASFA